MAFGVARGYAVAGCVMGASGPGGFRARGLPALAGAGAAGQGAAMGAWARPRGV